MFGLQISGSLWSWQDHKIREIKISSLHVFSYQHVSIQLRNHSCLHKHKPLEGVYFIFDFLYCLCFILVQASNPVNKQTNFPSNQTGGFSPGPTSKSKVYFKSSFFYISIVLDPT